MQVPPLQEVYRGDFVKDYMRYHAKNVDRDVVALVEKVDERFDRFDVSIDEREQLVTAPLRTWAADAAFPPPNPWK